jgi:hypothetical protein
MPEQPVGKIIHGHFSSERQYVSANTLLSLRMQKLRVAFLPDKKYRSAGTLCRV